MRPLSRRPRAEVVARALLAIACSSVAGAARAHGGGPPDAAPGWTFDLWIIGPLTLAALLFAIGWVRLRRRSGAGRAALGKRALLFAAGWLVLAGALVSPLHEAGERSFALHMAEHELLMLAAAPLLVLSEPLAVMLWAARAGVRRTLGSVATKPPIGPLWHALTQPVVATLLQAAALWLWHMPTLFDRALASPGWHVAQHLSFLVSALLFWSAMLHRRTRSEGWLVAALCLFATSLISGALGAVMALSQSPWYAAYARLGMAPFGLTPAEDQQMAGLLMWIPGGLVHAGAALAVVGAALAKSPATLEAADAA